VYNEAFMEVYIMYAHIAIVPRLGTDFSIEVRHDDEGTWETYFNGSCLTLASQCLNLAVRTYKDYPVRMVGWDDMKKPIQGAVFNVIRDKEVVKRFFRETKKPFENRKVYQYDNPGCTVGFDMIGI